MDWCGPENGARPAQPVGSTVDKVTIRAQHGPGPHDPPPGPHAAGVVGTIGQTDLMARNIGVA